LSLGLLPWPLPLPLQKQKAKAKERQKQRKSKDESEFLHSDVNAKPKNHTVVNEVRYKSLESLFVMASVFQYQHLQTYKFFAFEALKSLLQCQIKTPMGQRVLFTKQWF
jgi:hypothetical protein